LLKNQYTASLHSGTSGIGIGVNIGRTQ